MPAMSRAGSHDPIFVCRCEEVTQEEILEAIRLGCRSLDEVKRMTRAGMGRCQGRCCGPIIANLLCKEAGVSAADVQPLTAQFPIDLVGLASLADEQAGALEESAGTSEESSDDPA